MANIEKINPATYADKVLDSARSIENSSIILYETALKVHNLLIGDYSSTEAKGTESGPCAAPATGILPVINEINHRSYDMNLKTRAILDNLLNQLG